MEEEIRGIFEEFQQNAIGSFGEFASRYFDFDITDPTKQGQESFFISEESITAPQVQACYEYLENRDRIEEVGVYAMLYALAGRKFKPGKAVIREKFLNNAY